MEIENYIEKMKDFQEIILEYIDNEDEDVSNFPNIIDFFSDQKTEIKRDELRSILDLISNISKNHHRIPNFFSKIGHILLQIKEKMQLFFTNYELFKLFEKDKRLLLLLFDEKIIKPEQLIAADIQNEKYVNRYYHLYFFPELSSFYDQKYKQKVFKETIEFQENTFEEFNEKRRIGENDNYLYELIREDSIDEFITLINKKNYSLTAPISPSIFETNLFLLKNESSMIEYSAFFGSIQIFRFLILNGVELPSLLWLYVIHGRNPDLIHALEENCIKPVNDSYDICINESIKCYHKELTTYIEENLFEKSQNVDFDISIQGMKYKNYFYFPNDLINELSYYYFCKYNYIYLYKLLIKMTYIKINTKIILSFYFHQIFI